MKDDQLMENASLTFLQLLCLDVTLTTTAEKRDIPTNILTALDSNAYQTTRQYIGDANYTVTTTLTFLNQERYREQFKKLMFRIRLEFGDDVKVQAKDTRLYEV